jgi:hypothetical protein
MIRIVKTDDGKKVTVSVETVVIEEGGVAAIAEDISDKLDILESTMSAGNFDVVSYDTKGNLTCKNVAPTPDEPDTSE